MASRLYKTIRPTGGDYTSLEACMHANEKNLVTSDEYFDIEIDGDWTSADTTAVTIHNYTTDATRYINIYTTAQARHSGVYDTTKYRLILDPGWNGTVLSSTTANYITITGIQIDNTGGGNSGQSLSLSGTNAVFDKGIIISCPGNGAYLGSTSEIRNTIVYDAVTTGIMLTGSGSKARNCTVGYSGRGIRAYWIDCIATNCLCRNNTSGDFVRDGSSTFTVTYCASSDATGDDWGGAGNRINQTFSMVAPTGTPRDFHLNSDDGGAINYGTDLSAYFTDDIDGQTRPTGAGTWDIGADEYVTTGYILTAEGGSCTITGTTVSLLKSSVLNAEAGSCILTGQVVGLLKSHILVADSGSYVLTGQDVNLLIGRCVVADSGVYTITGTALDMLKSSILSADSGIYLLTGQDVSLLKSSLISADAGTYNITGIAVDLLKSFLLSAEVGDYIIIGQDVTLTYTSTGYVLTCDAGTFNVTGQDASLLKNSLLSANAGSIIITPATTYLVYDKPKTVWDGGATTWDGTSASDNMKKIKAGATTFTKSKSASSTFKKSKSGSTTFTKVKGS